MKNLINKLPLMAFVLGFGLMITTSAFTTKDSVKGMAVIYGYDESNLNAPWVANQTPGYSCVLSDKVCKYQFATPPSNSPITPRSAGTPMTGLGSYQE